MRLALALVLVASCGTKHDNGNTEVDGGTTDVDSGVLTCTSTSCPDGQFCSGNGTCIDNGFCKVDGDCMPGFGCNAAGLCEQSGCGGSHLNLTYIPPNVEIVLDRSCSMKKMLDGTATTKWDAAVAALSHVLDTHATDIRWGATLFPDTTGESCAQDAIPFPVANGNAPGIKALLVSAQAKTDPNYPDGPCVTNIDTGIEQAATDPALGQANRQSFMMLVTDGAQSSCSLGGGATGAVTAIMNAATAGVKTFVVGFGSEVDATQLNKFADAGGEALTGANHYYQADTATALDQAFQAISALTVSCTYKVDPAPTDLSQTWVYESGNQLIPRDTTHANGWDYDDANQHLTLYGPPCDHLKDLTVTMLDVIFGCPTPPIQ